MLISAPITSKFSNCNALRLHPSESNYHQHFITSNGRKMHRKIESKVTPVTFTNNKDESGRKHKEIDKKLTPKMSTYWHPINKSKFRLKIVTRDNTNSKFNSIFKGTIALDQMQTCPIDMSSAKLRSLSLNYKGQEPNMYVLTYTLSQTNTRKKSLTIRPCVLLNSHLTRRNYSLLLCRKQQAPTLVFI